MRGAHPCPGVSRSGRAARSRSNSARTRPSSAGSTGVRLWVNSTISACFFLDCVTLIQPFALPSCTVRVYELSVTCSTPLSARAARNARMPFQSYGGRYESCRVEVWLSVIALDVFRRLLAEPRRRHPVAPAERVVEPAQAREAAGERDLGDGQRRFGQQLLGQQQPARQQQLNRRDAQLLLDDAANLPRAELELVGDLLESRLLVEMPFLETLHDQLRDALRVVHRRAARRQFRTAAQAGAEARPARPPAGCRRSGSWTSFGVFAGTDRPAVDAGRRDADEEDPVEARIAGRQAPCRACGCPGPCTHDTASAARQSSHFRTSTGICVRCPKTASTVRRPALSRSWNHDVRPARASTTGARSNDHRSIAEHASVTSTRSWTLRSGGSRWWRPTTASPASCGRTTARGVCGSTSRHEDGGHPVLLEAERQLEEYFAGQRKAFALKLDLAGTPFQRQVWNALLTIPFGETRSYGQIAKPDWQSCCRPRGRCGQRQESRLDRRAVPSGHRIDRQAHRICRRARRQGAAAGLGRREDAGPLLARFDGACGLMSRLMLRGFRPLTSQERQRGLGKSRRRIPEHRAVAGVRDDPQVGPRDRLRAIRRRATRGRADRDRRTRSECPAEMVARYGGVKFTSS